MKLSLSLISASIISASVILAGCQGMSSAVNIASSQSPAQANIQKKVIESIGYGSIVNFQKAPEAQRKLLAIRAAKVDAYRNLAEEVYGIKIKGNTTVKDMVVQNDNYRISLDAMLRGAHIKSITEKKKGFFEAEVSLTLTPRYTICLFNPEKVCLNSSNQYQSDIIDVQAEQKEKEGEKGLGIFSTPKYRYHID
ncbi:MAG: LPP20 family lipoprotein [Gammaproteobacteria bacterium]|nr:LPP20 family lipoprotein [Gammaproteobacteria bacterium]